MKADNQSKTNTHRDNIFHWAKIKINEKEHKDNFILKRKIKENDKN